jgi:hypothetical protein
MSNANLPEGTEAKKDTPAFHLEEYKMLREEILEHLKEIYRTEALGAAAIVSVYTWLFTHDRAIIPAVAWYVPPFVLLVCAARCFDLTSKVSDIGKYLKNLEKLIFHEAASTFGWEHYKSERPWMGRRSVGVSILFWATAFAVILVTSLRLSNQSPLPQASLAGNSTSAGTNGAPPASSPSNSASPAKP